MSIKPFQKPLTYVRRRWNKPWRLITDLRCTQASRSCAPVVSEALFLWEYGRRNTPSDTTLKAYQFTDYLGWFVQVRVDNHEVFTGILVDDDLHINGAITDGGDIIASGDQFVRAAGLELLLDRHTPHSSKALNTTGEGEGESTSYELVEIDYLPGMNSNDGTVFGGNRSKRPVKVTGSNGSTTVTTGDAGTYRYSGDGAEWTHRQFLNMLLADNHPDNLTYYLAGQDEILDMLITMAPIEGLTLQQILNRLVDRRRGLGWKIGLCGKGPGPAIPVEIFATCNQDITVGDTVLTFNPYVVSVDLDFTDPENDIVSLKLSETTRYDRIRVVGERITSCFTISGEEFTKGWTDAQEKAYDEAAKKVNGYSTLDDTEKATLNDAFRADDRFDAVYRLFKLPSAWDWKDWQGNYINPTLDDNGEPISSQDTYSRLPRRLMRLLPLKTGMDYTKATPVELSPSREYLPPLVLIKYDGKYYPVHRLGEMLTDDSGNRSPQATIRMADDQMAVDVTFRPGVLAAKNHWPENAEPSNYLPVFDWNDYLITVAVKTDQRLAVIATSEGVQTDSDRELTIDIPGTEFWYMPAGTVFGVNSDGSPLRRDPSLGSAILRNDNLKLQAIAAAALSWYGRLRQILRLRRTRIDFYDNDSAAQIGDLIVSVAAEQDYDNINTVLTQITWDFESGQTTLQTAHGQLDFNALLDMDRADLGDSRAVAIEIKRQNKKLAELEKHTQNIPVRQAIGGSGVSGNRLAKTKVAATSGTTVECNLLDSEGNEIDNAITVNFFWTLSDHTFPEITNEKTIPVFKNIDGYWYCPISIISLQTDCS